MGEPLLKVSRDGYGWPLPLLGRSPRFVDGAGLSAPSQTDAQGLLTLTPPQGATVLHVCCPSQAMKVGDSDSNLDEDTAGGFVNVAANTWFTVFVADCATVNLKCAAQANVDWFYDFLG